MNLDAPEGIVRLIAPLERQMFHAVWRVLRHPQDAEDALQSALATIWQKRLQIERHPAPQALVMKICADAAVDQFRRRGRRKQETLAPWEGKLRSADPEPLDEAIDHETLDMLMEAIARLSPNQASAIVMRFIEGQSHAEIAAALGCGVETVREHLARGRERLGRMLGKALPRMKSRPSSQNQPCAEE